MDIRKYTSSVSAILLAAIVCSSCERELADLLGRGKSDPNAIKVNVSSSVDYRETKSADAGAVLTRTFGDDDFSISEYVCDIEDVMEGAGTKGTIITTTGINTNGKSFTVDGWGMISPERGKPQVLTNHLPKLTASYTSSGTDHWPWAGGANPKWVNEANLHIWSYYPVGKIDPTITIDDAVDANNTAVFTNYTTDNTDLLIAYNKEYREFQKDAAGNHTYNADGEINDPIVGSPSFNVHFYHALAAIEFELETDFDGDNTQDMTLGAVDFHGVDIHSITICKVNTDGNIVTTDGIATTGDCTVKGPSISTDGITWENLSGKKPFHYEFGTGESVAGGYTSATGNGVFFMIPQDIQDIVVIVEFSKNGSTNYYTKVGKLKPSNETSMDVSWKAGKYYKYKLSIGEFHVPGENITLNNVNLSGLNNSTPQGVPTTPLKIKGVSKMGLVLDYYQLGSKEGQTVYVNGVVNGISQVSYGGSPLTPTTAQTTQEYNFQPVPDDPEPNTEGMIYRFGTDDVKEIYNLYYSFSTRTGSKKSKMTEYQAKVDGPFYYVFDTPGDGNKTFQVGFQPSAGDASGGFFASVRCLVVLEITPDSSIPDNFYTIDWSTI